jgi:CRISPR-associated protein Csb1
VSGFIEASGVREVVSGGVKNNPIDPTGKMHATGYDKDVYGNVPYTRVEYTAEKITAYFNIDLGLLRSYDLGDDALELLVALALFKIRRFLNSGLRLRTACDLKTISDLKVTEPDGFVIPSEDELLSLIKNKIASVKDMFANPPVTQISTTVIIKDSDKKESGE